MGPVRVVGIGGSLGRNSGSLAALKIALLGAAGAGALTQIFDVGAMNLPVYEPQAAEVPRQVREMCDAVGEADGLIWSSPLYHGTVSGAFKNALDWLELLSVREPAYLTDKAVGLIGAAGGTQGLQAINTMEYVVRALRGWTVPLVIPVSQAWRAFDADGRALDPKLDGQLRVLGGEVTRAASLFRRQPLTTPEAREAEADLQPLGRAELAP